FERDARRGPASRHRPCRRALGGGDTAHRRGARNASWCTTPRRRAARHQRPHAALQALEDARGRHHGARRPHARGGVAMSGVEMTRLLAEMQRLAATADARPSEATTETRGFAELLKSSIDAVAEAQANASDMAA